MRATERGVALLEVLAATAILGIAGLGLLELATANIQAVRGAAERERAFADAERLLTAYALLTREDLDRRLGQRDVGPYVVEIQRPERPLYRVALRRHEAPEVEVLVTVLYRPEGTNAQ